MSTEACRDFPIRIADCDPGDRVTSCRRTAARLVMHTVADWLGPTEFGNMNRALVIDEDVVRATHPVPSAETRHLL